MRVWCFSLIATLFGQLVSASSSSSSCGTEATQTVWNQKDADALASCTTFSGSIAIATSNTDDITLGMQEIWGDLVAVNVSGMQSLMAPDLIAIESDLRLEGLNDLLQLRFPSLVSVVNIFWLDLPNLNDVIQPDIPSATNGAPRPTMEPVDFFTIQNTGIDGLFDLWTFSSIEILNISNNRYLYTLEVDVNSIGTALAIEGNGAGLWVSLPNLQQAGDVTLQGNISEFDVPLLNFINGSLVLEGIVQLDQLPFQPLNVVKGDIQIMNNSNIRNMSFPNLISAGNLTIQNNTKLLTIEPDYFSQLGTVDTLSISGNLSKWVNASCS